MLTDQQVHDLFGKFSAPLLEPGRTAGNSSRLLELIVRTMWLGLIVGPEMEGTVWKAIAETLETDENTEIAKKCYEGLMKPQITDAELASLRERYEHRIPELLFVGEEVRARPGTTDPDYPDLPVGGWSGKIIEISEEPMHFLVKLNQETLKYVHPVYRKRCERDGYDETAIWLPEESLELTLDERVPMEQPTSIVTKPLDFSVREDRIRAVLGLTTDDAVPLVRRAHLRKYQRYLAAHLSFPFKARSSEPLDPAGKKEFVQDVTVVGLLDEPEIDEVVGLVTTVRGATTKDMPLCFLSVAEDDPNSQLVADYVGWFLEFDDPERDDEVAEDQERQPPPDTILRESRVGRNDPCPCGSGKKYKKCCLNKSRQDGPFG